LNYILGIDQATSKSGFVVMDGDYKIIEYGIIDTTNIGDTTEYGHTLKRQELKKNIKMLLEKYPKIIQVICEGVHLNTFKGIAQKNGVEIFKKLSKTQGTIEDICLELEISCFTFNVNSWRSYIDYKFGRSREEIKDNTKAYIIGRYNLPDNLEQDIYDATAICEGYLNMINKFS